MCFFEHIQRCNKIKPNPISRTKISESLDIGIEIAIEIRIESPATRFPLPQREPGRKATRHRAADSEVSNHPSSRP